MSTPQLFTLCPRAPPASVQIVAVKHFEKIWMSLKVTETEGKKIRATLINLDLTGRWWHHDDIKLSSPGPNPGPNRLPMLQALIFV